MSGQFDDLLMIKAFSIDVVSSGSPAIIYDCIASSSPRTCRRRKVSPHRILVSLINGIQLSVIMLFL